MVWGGGVGVVGGGESTSTGGGGDGDGVSATWQVASSIVHGEKDSIATAAESDKMISTMHVSPIDTKQPISHLYSLFCGHFSACL